MKELSLHHINNKSPYRVICSDKGDYLFATDKGINYTISFTEEFPLGGCMSYQFCIHNDNKIHGSYDNKISTTIIAIIEEFFLQNLNGLLYICDTSDNREEVRNRLFIRWFKEYADPQKYTIQSANTTIEGQGFYSSIIVENRNPLLDAIKADLTDQAKDRVKLNLILAAIVEAENIEVTDEERNSELETIANTYNRDLEEIKQIFAQNMYQIDADILNRKALDVVKENLKKA